MPRLKTAIPWSALTTSSPGTGKPASALPNVSELDAYGIKDPQPANERVKGASLGATLTLRRPVAKLRGDFSTHARLGKLGCRIQVARDGQHARAAERGGVLGSRPSPCGRHRGYLEPIPRRASFQGRHQSPGCVARSRARDCLRDHLNALDGPMEQGRAAAGFAGTETPLSDPTGHWTGAGDTSMSNSMYIRLRASLGGRAIGARLIGVRVQPILLMGTARDSTRVAGASVDALVDLDFAGRVSRARYVV